MAANIPEARKRSVDNLQRLYTVVISLAVTEVVRRTLLQNEQVSPPDLGAVPVVQWFLLGCFLFTVIPFYHGANRYLDATYVTKERSASSVALLIDFVALFVEGVIFFVLAVFLTDTQQFFTILSILLIIDAMWVGMTHLYQDPPLVSSHNTADKNERSGFLIFAQDNPPYGWWALMNTGVAGLLLLFTWSNMFNSDFQRGVAGFFLVALRSVLDYGIVWRFYYPPELTLDSEQSIG